MLTPRFPIFCFLVIFLFLLHRSGLSSIICWSSFLMLSPISPHPNTKETRIYIAQQTVYIRGKGGEIHYTQGRLQRSTSQPLTLERLVYSLFGNVGTFLKKSPLDLIVASKTQGQLISPTRINFLVIQGHSLLMV